jgi:hypothetical protein
MEFSEKSWRALRSQEMASESASLESRLREVDGKLDISSSTNGTILRVSLLATNTREPHRISATGNT